MNVLKRILTILKREKFCRTLIKCDTVILLSSFIRMLLTTFCSRYHNYLNFQFGEVPYCYYYLKLNLDFYSKMYSLAKPQSIKICCVYTNSKNEIDGRVNNENVSMLSKDDLIHFIARARKD